MKKNEQILNENDELKKENDIEVCVPFDRAVRRDARKPRKIHVWEWRLVTLTKRERGRKKKNITSRSRLEFH